MYQYLIKFTEVGKIIIEHGGRRGRGERRIPHDGL